MHRKAQTFGDEATAAAVLAEPDPARVKALGRCVSPYDDVRWSDKLFNYMQGASPQETQAEQQKRSTVMAEITELFRAWVASVCESKGVPHELAIKAGGQVLTSGSYRLGINEKGMDIDTICVAPQPVTREDFFGSLQAILEDHDSVENLR